MSIYNMTPIYNESDVMILSAPYRLLIWIVMTTTNNLLPTAIKLYD